MPPTVLSRTTPIAAAAVLLLALLSRLVLGDAAITYDTQWGLAWGADLVRGDAPEQELLGASTPHPLVTLVAAIAQVVGADDAPNVLHALAFLGHGALIVAVVLLGASLFSWAAGLAGGAAIALCIPASETTPAAFPDVSAAALVLLAALVAVRRPQRPIPALVLLGLAGLLRPEPWGLAAAYALWESRERNWVERARLGAVALLGPVLWMLHDLVITGEPLDSFTRTRSGAEAASRTTGIGEGPSELARQLRFALEEAILAGGLAGGAIVLALWWHRRGGGAAGGWARLAQPGQLVLLVLGLLLALAFMTLAVGELSLLPRYLIGLMGVIAVLYGFAVTGWLSAPPGRLRTAWAAVAIVLVAGTIHFARGQVDWVRGTLDFLRDERAAVGALRDLDEDPAAGTAFARCGTIAVYGYRIRPYLAYELDRQAGDLVVAPRPASLQGGVAWVAPATDRAVNRFVVLGRAGTPVPAAPRGFRRVADNGDWNLFTRDC